MLRGLFDWLSNRSPDSPGLLAFTGNAGSGKTFHLLQLQRILNRVTKHSAWERALSDDGRLRKLRCLFISFAELCNVNRLGELSLEQMVEIVLRNRGADGDSAAHTAAYFAQARAGELVLIFDGLNDLIKLSDNLMFHIFGQLLRVFDRSRTTSRRLKLLPTAGRTAQSANSALLHDTFE